MTVPMQLGTRGHGARPEINVTPLVDVVLVLLIIFMLVTPMLQRGQGVLLPTATNVARRSHPEPLLVSVTLDKEYWIDNEKVGEWELDAAVKRALVEKPGRRVLIKADKRLTCGPVKRAIGAVHKAGLPGAALAAQPPSGPATATP